jgi:hypothetical protein
MPISQVPFAGISNPVNFRNRIINGNMQIDQRNAGASVTLDASGVYPVDRFRCVESTDGGMTGEQVQDAPTNFTDSLKITTTTADGTLAATQFCSVDQFIEGYNVADLNWGTANAKSVTLSFYVKSSLTGTFGGCLINSADNRSYVFTYSISLASTWEYKTITIEGDTSGTWLTNNGRGIGVRFGLGVGSTYSGTADTWTGSLLLSATGAVSVIGTLNATWQITGVQLEAGEQASGFEFMPIDVNLGRCLRYYQLIASGATPYFCNAVAQTATNAFGVLSLPVKMRTSPTGSVVSGTNYYRFVSFDTDDNINSVNVNGQTDNIVNIANNSEISQTQGRAGLFTCLNAASFVACQAEL